MARMYGTRGTIPAQKKEQKLTRPICQADTWLTTRPSSVIIIRSMKVSSFEEQSFVSLLLSSALQLSPFSSSSISDISSSRICSNSYSSLYRSASTYSCSLWQEMQSPRPMPMASPNVAARATATRMLFLRLIALALRMMVMILMVPSSPPQMKDLRNWPTSTCSSRCAVEEGGQTCLGSRVIQISFI